jgi:hypothetical protein
MDRRGMAQRDVLIEVVGSDAAVAFAANGFRDSLGTAIDDRGVRYHARWERFWEHSHR